MKIKSGTEEFIAKYLFVLWRGLDPIVKLFFLVLCNITEEIFGY